jgi:hypothetical protein
MGIYRSTSKTIDSDELIVARKTARAPTNVPYIVDNLWEWKRPSLYPNRRLSVYASPAPELAKKWGGSGLGEVYRVEMKPPHMAAQAQVEDSRDHDECKKLPKLLIGMLGEKWTDESLESRTEVGRLWMPCLKKQEIEYLFDSVDALRAIKEAIWEAVSYWDDVSILHDSGSVSGSGEIFFEPVSGYKLVKA